MNKLELLLKERGQIKKIGVIGMGYVGIPSAVLFADAPCFNKVLGFQRNSKSSGYKIDMLNLGECPLRGEEPDLEDLLARVVKAGKLECTHDFSKISGLDAVTLAIQTPFANPKDLEPDFSALFDGIRNVGKYLRPGILVVLESTITPGTTEGIAKQILEDESDLKAGEDFALAHAPERVMVGRLLKNIREHDRIVGGINETSTRRAVELYSPVLTIGKVIPMSATAAEVTKTAENTFRDLQIAAINQLALYCEAMGINVYDVRKGVDSLKGEGITRAVLWPGAGVGGHCLTKDTYHLERGVKMGNSHLDYPEDTDSIYILARKINDFMPTHMYNLTTAALEKIGKRMKGAKIAILGWAFIRDSDDARNTPSEPYRNLCLKAEAKIMVHDPYVMNYPGIEISDDLKKVVMDADAVVFLAEHSEYFNLKADWIKKVTGKENTIVVDGRNVIEPDDFISKGFVYKGIGRGDKNEHVVVLA